MRMIAPLVRDDVGDYDSAVQHYRNGAARRLRYARPRVLAAYQQYAANQQNLTAVGQLRWTERQTIALKDLYSLTSKRRPLAYIRDFLLNRVPPEFCPYCSFGEAETLDHFLPQSLFPEFSLLSRNLVPCCPTCNRIKTAKNASHAIHAYFDDINTRIVFATVNVAQTISTSYELRNPNGMNPDLFARCERQFDLLNLAGRWKKQASLTIANRRGALRRTLETGGIRALRENLLSEAESYRENAGQNGFGFPLYEALAGSQVFLNSAGALFA
jgi:5-methylcytosine-specific restriction endonuclease McrA